MLNVILLVLLALWLLGMVSAYTMGGFIHLLLFLAIAVVLDSRDPGSPGHFLMGIPATIPDPRPDAPPPGPPPIPPEDPEHPEILPEPRIEPPTKENPVQDPLIDHPPQRVNQPPLRVGA